MSGTTLSLRRPRTTARPLTPVVLGLVASAAATAAPIAATRARATGDEERLLIHPPFLSNDRLILALVSACGERRLNVGWSLNEQCSPERGIVRDANDAESTAGGDAGPCACVELGELSAASSVRALPDDHRLEVLQAARRVSTIEKVRVSNSVLGVWSERLCSSDEASASLRRALNRQRPLSFRPWGDCTRPWCDVVFPRCTRRVRQCR